MGVIDGTAGIDLMQPIIWQLTPEARALVAFKEGVVRIGPHLRMKSSSR